MQSSDPPLERRYLRSHDLSYAVGGVGPPLVLLHGLGGSSGNWTDLARYLLPRYRLLVPDLPGHGASGRGTWDSTLASFGDAVRVCAEAESIEAPVVVGHSFGGQLAVSLAAGRPAWPRGIVLAAASGITSARPGRRRALRVASIVRPARRANPLRRWTLRHRRARRLAFSGMVSDIDSLSDAAAEAFLAGAAEATTTRPALRALMERDPRLDLHRVDVPVLVLWGARDAALPIGDGIDYARRLRARLRVLADTGHLLIGERPGQCAALIDEFVVDLPG